ncbi:WYL domain-containing protein [Pseudomonas aeruginosa]|uniref:helix-turn-helix transcriptional regulator n=1 Tax=Pseudomonas aeruginosa TaxID=287 RepID=UPI0021F20380|nr:WYL domain-containing protein [Pseudomonas aeruginosa]MCV4011969.1 WYL domain-containing protein [Pseudomonas aeruginosa]MCV6207584.1 WYL domain-containing protein [Pseudomonas aeruginosa]
MSEAKDTLLRQLTLLRLIPEYPRYTSSQTLHEKLQDRGYKVELRTVQRDLNRLSAPFSLTNNKKGGRNEWSYTKGTPLDLRDMEPSTALALYLAESHLSTLLPQSVLDLLGPQFNRARNYLDNLGQNDLAHWARRVRTHPNGKALLPAQVDSEIWRAVSNALLVGRQLRVDYLSRSKADAKMLIIHPAGLVSRQSIGYLIGTVDGYDDLRQFALHRIRQAECLDTPACERPDFDIDHYIRQNLNTTTPIEQVELVANVSPQIAWLLGETPLSTQQSLEPLEGSDWKRLRATVPDDQETLWWVFGLGENVRVHKPATWIQTVRQKAAGLEALYAP